MVDSTNNFLIYEAEYYFFIPYRKTFLALGSVLLVGAIVVAWLSGGLFWGLFTIGFILFFGLLVWLLGPRKFQIYDDHISIRSRLRNKVAAFDTIERIGYVESQVSWSPWFYDSFRPTFLFVKISMIDGDTIKLDIWDPGTFVEEATKALD